MGCHFSKNSSKSVDVGSKTLFSMHKNITEWERNDYKKRINKRYLFI
tara:strand:- start:1014 stop:1154 length:141 start_codon:yes stop_codon:yes gene_type:complete